jgi:DNA polymerase III delta prime subunit
LVARESGRDVLELNASDARSKKALGEALGDVTGSQVLSFDKMGKKASGEAPVRRKRCIIMDEVDGMGAGDRSGMSELIQMIKKSKVPIVSNLFSSIVLFPVINLLISPHFVFLSFMASHLSMRRFASATTVPLPK